MRRPLSFKLHANNLRVRGWVVQRPNLWRHSLGVGTFNAPPFGGIPLGVACSTYHLLLQMLAGKAGRPGKQARQAGMPAQAGRSASKPSKQARQVIGKVTTKEYGGQTFENSVLRSKV